MTRYLSWREEVHSVLGIFLIFSDGERHLCIFAQMRTQTAKTTTTMMYTCTSQGVASISYMYLYSSTRLKGCRYIPTF